MDRAGSCCPRCFAVSLVVLAALVITHRTIHLFITSQPHYPTSRAQAAAEQHLPPLSNHAGKTLTILDTKGMAHEVQFRYWTNTQSRMYIMEGMLDVQTSYNLSAGDVVVFASVQDQLVVYGRKATPADVQKPTRGGSKPATTKRRAPVQQESPTTTATMTNPPKRVKLFLDTPPSTTPRRSHRLHPTPPTPSYPTPTHAIDEDTIMLLCHALDIEEQRQLLPQPILDGVFREITPPTLPRVRPPATPRTKYPCSILIRAVYQQGVWLYDAGCWLASVAIEGTLFHAAFSTRKDAEDALLAARQQLGVDEGV